LIALRSWRGRRRGGDLFRCVVREEERLRDGRGIGAASLAGMGALVFALGVETEISRNLSGA